MKIKGKHIAITAGLSAVLALSPVVGTVSSVYAEGDGSAANARVAAQIDVTFSYDGKKVATVADENGNIDPSALGLPAGYT
ncbi:hypothetical protein, partial [Collinsella sp. An268]|uniref:hypothetical protein n=1 Tax=Collinsella sp. An268 TaxID=1965612 RepID=UPI000B5837E6